MSPPTAAVVKFTKHKNTSKKFFNYNVVWPNWKENYYKYNFSLLYFFSNKDIGQTMFGLWYLLQIHILPTLRNPVVPPPPPFSPGIWKLTFWSIFFFPHHRKPGCPPSWQWMDSLWNWRRAGWSAALYGADKTPGRATTLHKTSSIISCGQDRPDYGGGIGSFLVFKKVRRCCFTIHPILYSSSWWDCTRSPRLTTLLT